MRQSRQPRANVDPTHSSEWTTAVAIAISIAICVAAFVWIFVRLDPYLSDFVSDDSPTPTIEASPTAHGDEMQSMAIAILKHEYGKR